MTEDRISPEEKLLGLIRNNKAGKKEEEKEIAPLVEKKKKGAARKLVFTRPHLKPVLIVVIILLFGVMGYESSFKTSDRNRIDSLGRKEKPRKMAGEEPLVLRPYSYYSQEIEGKSIFSPLVIEKTATTISRGEKIEELVKNYRLKGVIVGEKPEAFIEDIQAHRTFTVTIGDTVGKLGVKDIKEGRVTFSYEEETYDLSF